MNLTDRPTAVSGNVTVHPTAQVAMGVMLHADPGSHLVIGAGACIGWGCVVHAHSGTLVIGQGVTLGMGTLVLGNSQVGDYACIGPASTILNSVVRPRAVIPPNSLISATVGRAVPPAANVQTATVQTSAPEPSVVNTAPTDDLWAEPPVSEAPHIDQPAAITDRSPVARAPTAASHPPAAEPTLSPVELPIQITEVPQMPVNLSLGTPIYGKKSLERLLATLRNEKPDIG